MSDPAEEQISHCEENHRVGDVEPLLVIADQTTARRVTQRVDDSRRSVVRLRPCLADCGKQAFERNPFLIGQVARIALRLLLNGQHAAARRCVPHLQHESRPNNGFKPLSSSL